MTNRHLFLLVTAFLDAVGLGIIFPIGPDLIGRFVADPLTATRVYGLFVAVYALMQFVASPMLGALSDLYGRRVVLLTGLAGAAIDYVIMAYAGSLPILFIGRVISGMSGGTITVATAYITDVTPEDQRAARFGQLSAAFGVGFIFGPVLGGLLGKESHVLPFLVAAGLNGVNFLYGFFVLPESLPKERRRPFTRAALSPVTSLRWVFSQKAIIPLVAVYFLINMVGHFIGSMWAIYNRDKFSWDQTTIGLSLSAFGLMMAFAQSLLPQRMIGWLGERGAVMLGLFGMAVGYMGVGLAGAGWMIFALIPLIASSEAGIPALQAMIAKGVEQARQGELQGTLVALASVAGIIGPLVATSVYTPALRGLPFLLGAAILVLCIPFLRQAAGSAAPSTA